jgi:adenylate cyclase
VRNRYLGGAEEAMRRQLVPFIVLTLIGFAVGGLYRAIFDTPVEATPLNYVRSGIHGAALGLAGYAVHLYFTSRSSAWVRRWPLAVELLLRSVAIAVVIAFVATAFEAVLYDHSLEAKWFATDFPKIMVVAFALSVVVAVRLELTRLIGGRVFFNVMIGRYRRPIREERILMFLDLAGSTTLAEQMGEVRVQDLLTRFFYDIDAAITGHGGEVHAYVGDEVIVTWPVTGGRRDRRCLDCFYAIQDRVAALAGQYRREFGLVPTFRAGLHAGTVVISECGDSHRQVAYFGDTVNVTARLQAQCKELGRSLLVSGDLLRLIERDQLDGLAVEAMGPTELRGRTATVDVFSIARVKNVHQRSSLGASVRHAASGDPR